MNGQDKIRQKVEGTNDLVYRSNKKAIKGNLKCLIKLKNRN